MFLATQLCWAEKDKSWKADSINIANLKIAYSKEISDTQRLGLLLKIGKIEKKINPDSSLKHLNQALIIAQAYYYDVKIAEISYLLGLVHYNKSELVESRYYLLQCLPYYKQLGDQKMLMMIYQIIGRTSFDRGSYSIALKFFLQLLDVSKDLGDNRGISDSYHAIAKIYDSQNDKAQAIEYNKRALDIRKAIGYKPGIAASSFNLGLIMVSLNRLDEALAYANHALSLRLEEKLEKNHAEPYELLGKIYNLRGEYITSIMYYKNAIKIWKKYADSKDDLAENYIGLGAVYVDNLGPIVGIREYKKALEISEQIGNNNLTLQSYLALYNTYNKLGEHQNTLKYLKLYSSLSKKLVTEGNRILLEDMELENSILQQEKEIKLLKKDAALKELWVKKEEDTIQKGKIIVNILLGILATTLLIGYFIFNSYRLKNRTNRLLTEKNKIIKKHRKDILSSINYASRIQNAFFVTKSKIKEYFPDSFVLFKPKDIVSGDFYWLKKFKSKIYFAAADCTGHGVRGALISIMCQDLLNRSLENSHDNMPEKLLAWISQQLMDNLGQRLAPDSGEFGVKDGMDIALCCLDEKSLVLSFAGSHSPLYLIRNGELSETKGDKNFIGRVIEKEVYNTHTIPLKKGDRLYLFSDGYADQKGGPKNKKFYYPPFKQLLLEIHQSPMDEQKEILNNTLIAWRGDNDQFDDILIFGIQV